MRAIWSHAKLDLSPRRKLRQNAQEMSDFEKLTAVFAENMQHSKMGWQSKCQKFDLVAIVRLCNFDEQKVAHKSGI